MVVVVVVVCCCYLLSVKLSVSPRFLPISLPILSRMGLKTLPVGMFFIIIFPSFLTILHLKLEKEKNIWCHKILYQKEKFRTLKIVAIFLSFRDIISLVKILAPDANHIIIHYSCARHKARTSKKQQQTKFLKPEH